MSRIRAGDLAEGAGDPLAATNSARTVSVAAI